MRRPPVPHWWQLGWRYFWLQRDDDALDLYVMAQIEGRIPRPYRFVPKARRFAPRGTAR